MNDNPFLIGNTNESESEKPLIRLITHASELKVESKKLSNIINIENFRKTNLYDPKISNFIDPNNKESFFLNVNPFTESISSNPFNMSMNRPIFPRKEIKKQPKNNNRSINSSSIISQNKNCLGKQKNKNQIKKVKNKPRKRNKSSSSNSNLSSINIKMSKSSKRTNSSHNSTKRSKLDFKEHDTPEKYPEDYLTVDPPSEDEAENNNNISDNNNINNSLNKSNYLFRKITEIENGNMSNKIKEEVKQQLKGFDLYSLNLKDLFNDSNFKKKYHKNIKKEIKIVYFDKEIRPLHAIFVFFEKGKNIGGEKKLLSGAYDKEEFIQFCEEHKTASAKVELLADFANLNKSSYLNWMEPNQDLFIDFYFLINIKK